MKGIAEMFEDLTHGGYERYEVTLEIVNAKKRTEAVERTRQWRLDNPERARKARKIADRTYRASDKGKISAKARARRYRDNHRAHMRAVWRRNGARRRARLRAAKEHPCLSG